MAQLSALLLRWFPLILACLSVIAAAVGALSLSSSDEGTYSYGGFAWILHDDLPYRDFVENKPPGIFLVWGLVWLLAGGSPIFGRFLALGSVVAAGIILSRVSRRIWNNAVTWIAGPLFISAFCAPYIGFPYADTESFSVLFVAISLSLSWPDDGRAMGWGRALLAGLCAGIAIMFKPVFIVDAVIISALMSHRARSLRPLAGAVPGILLPIAAGLVYFTANGILDDFYQVCIAWVTRPGTLPTYSRFGLIPNLRILARMFGRIESPVILVSTGFALASFVEWIRSSRRPYIIAFGLWTLLALAVVFAQGTCSFHHFKQLIIPLTILAAGIVVLPDDVAINQIAVPRLHQLCGFLMAIAMITSLFAMGREIVNADVPAAQVANSPQWASPEAAIVALTDPGDRIWAYPWSDLYTRSQRLSATRHLNSYYLENPGQDEVLFEVLRSGRARVAAIDWPRAARVLDMTTGCKPEFRARLRKLLETHFTELGISEDYTIYLFREDNISTTNKKNALP